MPTVRQLKPGETRGIHNGFRILQRQTYYVVIDEHCHEYGGGGPGFYTWEEPTPEETQAALEAQAAKVAEDEARYAEWVARSHSARDDPEWRERREVAERKADEARVNGYVYERERYRRMK